MSENTNPPSTHRPRRTLPPLLACVQVYDVEWVNADGILISSEATVELRGSQGNGIDDPGDSCVRVMVDGRDVSELLIDHAEWVRCEAAVLEACPPSPAVAAGLRSAL